MADGVCNKNEKLEVIERWIRSVPKRVSKAEVCVMNGGMIGVMKEGSRWIIMTIHLCVRVSLCVSVSVCTTSYTTMCRM